MVPNINWLSSNGVSANGLSHIGLNANDGVNYSVHELSVKGLSLDGLSLDGLSLDGLSLDGSSVNEFKVNEFSKSQQEVVELIKSKRNIFLTGIAGSGKSYLISKLRDTFPDKQIVLTSTTGISAFNIGGFTIHSYLALGLGDREPKESVRRLSNPAKISLRRLDILVIDEVSMLSAELFQKINEILQRIRGNCYQFGGVQIILSGDLLQLEIIGSAFKPIIESRLFPDFVIATLTTNFRQKEDSQWSELLNRLRVNELTHQDLALLKNKVEQFDEHNDLVVIKSTNAGVNSINESKYRQLSGDEHTYKMAERGSKTLLYDLRKQFVAKGSAELKLKVGCKVMLTRNLDTCIGLTNGAIGMVTGFTPTGLPFVKFDHLDFKVIIERQEWVQEMDKERCSITQIPLILSWANTVHKCQGISLTKAVIDISSAFCNHQVYVALSRVRSLDGLRLKSFNENKIVVNEKMIKFYSELSERERELSDEIDGSIQKN
jgi:ATP-dependent DNA helicase PIF1